MTNGLVPGANSGGTNTAVPGTANPTTGIGGTSNPLLPAVPSGSTMPSIYSPYAAFPANGSSGTDSTAALAGLNPATQFGGQNGSWAPNQHDFIKAMGKAGYSAGDAGMLWNFLQGGAGYNPQVAQALIASLQPQVQRGEADILEQFSAQGMRFGTPAAVGMGDFLSQVNLNEGKIISDMYEQSVSNYMNVLMGGKRQMQPTGSTFQNLMEYIRTMASTIPGNGGGGGA